MKRLVHLLRRLSGALPRIHVNGVPLLSPPEMDGVLPVSHGERCSFEPLAYAALDVLLEPGMLAYDVGASYGVMTALMALRVGPGGSVHSFEANPEVLAPARALLRANGLENSVHFENVLVGDRSADAEPFYAVPGSSSVASTRNTDIKVFHPDSRELSLPMIRLDDYAARINHTPDCIKIDIEGSEYVALEGARRLLQSRRPDLVIETHGLEVAGIGGSVAALCGLLGQLGYPLFDLGGRRRATPEGYAAEYAGHGKSIGYLLASTRLEDPAVGQRLAEQLATIE